MNNVGEIKQLRISPQLALFFNATGEPSYRDATLPADQVEAVVRNWLSTNDGGTTEYAFVDRWYSVFDGAKTTRNPMSVNARNSDIPRRPPGVRPLPLVLVEPSMPAPSDFGLTPEDMKIYSTPLPSWEDPGWVFGVGLVIGLLWGFRIGIFFLFVPMFAAVFAGLFNLLALSIVRLLLRYRRQRRSDYEPYTLYAAAMHRYLVSKGEFADKKAKYAEQLRLWECTQLDWWQALDGRGFELELGRLLAKRGYEVTPTPATNDGGVDLILRRHRQTILVQCKAHKGLIGPAPVRDLYGTFNHFGGSEALLVATSGFTIRARLFASGKRIRLTTIQELLAELTD